MKNGARILAGFRIEEQFAGHAQVDKENAVIEFKEDLLSVAANFLNEFAFQTFDGGGKIAPGDAAREKLDMPDGASFHVRRDGADDGFYFGKFGQVLLLR